MTDNIFDLIFCSKTLFKNKEILRHDYQPQNLPHRKSEIETLSFNLVEALKGHIPSNMTLYGVTGAEKTAVTSFVCDELESKEKLNRPVQTIMSIADKLIHNIEFLALEIPYLRVMKLMRYHLLDGR